MDVRTYWVCIRLHGPYDGMLHRLHGIRMACCKYWNLGGWAVEFDHKWTVGIRLKHAHSWLRLVFQDVYDLFTSCVILCSAPACLLHARA